MKDLVESKAPIKGKAQANILARALSATATENRRILLSGNIPRFDIISQEWVARHPKAAIIPLALTAPIEQAAFEVQNPETWPGTAAMLVAGRLVLAPATKGFFAWLSSKGWANVPIGEAIKSGADRALAKKTPLTTETIQGILRGDPAISDEVVTAFAQLSNKQKAIMTRLAKKGAPVQVISPRFGTAESFVRLKSQRLNFPGALEPREFFPPTVIRQPGAGVRPADIAAQPRPVTGRELVPSEAIAARAAQIPAAEIAARGITPLPTQPRALPAAGREAFAPEAITGLRRPPVERPEFFPPVPVPETRPIALEAATGLSVPPITSQQPTDIAGLLPAPGEPVDISQIQPQEPVTILTPEVFDVLRRSGLSEQQIFETFPVDLAPAGEVPTTPLAPSVSPPTTLQLPEPKPTDAEVQSGLAASEPPPPTDEPADITELTPPPEELQVSTANEVDNAIVEAGQKGANIPVDQAQRHPEVPVVSVAASDIQAIARERLPSDVKRLMSHPVRAKGFDLTTEKQHADYFDRLQNIAKKYAPEKLPQIQEGIDEYLLRGGFGISSVTEQIIGDLHQDIVRELKTSAQIGEQLRVLPSEINVTAVPLVGADVGAIVENADPNTLSTLMAQRGQEGVTDESLVKTLAKGSGRQSELNKAIKKHGATAVLDEVARTLQAAAEVPDPEAGLKQWLNEQGNKLREKLNEEDGFLRIPSRRKVQGVQETEDERVLREALEAGRQMTNRFGRFKDWVDTSKQNASDFLGVTFEPELKRAGDIQFRDDFRTGALPIVSKARNETQWEFDLIWGDRVLVPQASAVKDKVRRGKLAQKRRKMVLNLIGLEDFSQSMREGLKLPRNLQLKSVMNDQGEFVPLVDVELQRQRAAAPPEVLQALENYKTYARLVGEGMVARGELEPEALKDFYLPHRVIDYLPDWFEHAPFLPHKLRQPFQYYTFERKGSVRDIAISEPALYAHFATIKADHMLNDWAIGPKGMLPKNDIVPNLSADEKLALFGTSRKPKPQRYQVAGKNYRGIQYRPGRIAYRAYVANPELLMKAIENATEVDRQELLNIFDLPTEERLDRIMNYLSDIGPRGGAALRIGRVIGPYNKVYVVPEAIANKMQHFKEGAQNIPGLWQMNRFLKAWKSTAVGPFVGGVPFQVANWVGDAANLRKNVGALNPRHLDNSFDILRNLRPDNRHKLTPWQKHVLKVAEDKDIFGSGFLYEYSTIQPTLSVKGWLKKWQRLSGIRETHLRLAMLDHQLGRINAGLQPDAPEFRDIISNLDPESAAAFIAREFGGDYAAVPPWWKKWGSGMALPFGTWFQRSTKNWALYAKNSPGWFSAEMAIPVVGTWAYNNFVYPDIEGALPNYVREGWHVILPFGQERDDQGNPTAAIVLRPTLPHTVAASFLGMNLIGDKVTKVRMGRMTAKEAAKQQLIDTGLAPIKFSGRLLNPVANIILSLARNKDSFTGRQIVPGELANIPEYEKVTRYWTPYVIENLVLPYGQFLRGVGDDQRKFLLPEGEAAKTAFERYTRGQTVDAFARGLGYRRIDLRSSRNRELRELTRKTRGLWGKTMYDIENAFKATDGDITEFLQSPKTVTALEDARKRGIIITQDEIISILQSPRVNIDLLNRKIRQTFDKKEKLELEKKREMWLDISVGEAAGRLPTGAKPAFIEELLKRSD
jgi:hypothetical protein